MAYIYDKDGNIIDVGGNVNIVRQLFSGTPIAKINDVQIYAPQGGGGGSLSPLPTYTKIKGTIVDGYYLNSSAEAVASSAHKYAVYDVSGITGAVMVTTNLVLEGKKTCFGLLNGSVVFTGQSSGLPNGDKKGETLIDIVDVATIDTIKVNGRKTADIEVYIISSVTGEAALSDDYSYLEAVASQDKKALWLGDSIVQGVGAMYGTNAVKYAQQKLRTDCFNLGIGGGRMSEWQSRNKDFHNVLDGVLDGNWTKINEVLAGYSVNTPYECASIDEYQRLKTYITANGLFNIDFVFIAYGFNDWNGDVAVDDQNDKYNRSTICGALRSGIERIITAMPTTKIYVATPGYAHFSTADTDVDANDNNVYLKEVGDAIQEVCKSYHIPCYHQYEKNNVNSLNYSHYLIDGIHRTVFGYKILGEQYAKFIMSH